MTIEEATKIARIAERVDGGCPVCVESVVDQLNEDFPEFEWVRDADNIEHKVSVRIREAQATV